VGSVAVRRSDGVVAAAVVGRGVVIIDREGGEVARFGADTTGSVTWAADGSSLLGSSLLASSRGGSTVWAADDWEPAGHSIADRGACCRWR